MVSTRNFSYLPGLIEEAQYRAERMENAIEKIGGFEGVRELERDRIALKEEIAKFRVQRDELQNQKKEKEDVYR